MRKFHDKTPAIKRWLLRHPLFHWHFTPTSGSWLNMVERWFGELTNKKIKRGAHCSVRELERTSADWIKHWNENPKPYVWVKPAKEILDSIARYCQRIYYSDTRHASSFKPSVGLARHGGRARPRIQVDDEEVTYGSIMAHQRGSRTISRVRAGDQWKRPRASPSGTRRTRRALVRAPTARPFSSC